MAARSAIEHLCNVLAYFGISYMNPEVFRQAKLDNSDVCQRLWQANFDLIVLNMHNFTIRLQGTSETQPSLVAYLLAKSNCPVQLSANSSQALLLALSYLIAHTEIFEKYDQRVKYDLELFDLKHFWINGEFYSDCNAYLEANLPRDVEVSCNAILSLYNLAHKRVAQTAETMKYCIKLIQKIESETTYKYEDVLASYSESSYNAYLDTVERYERYQNQRETNLKLRGVFWDWVSEVADSLPDLEQSSPLPPSDFTSDKIHLMLENAQEVYQEVFDLWNKNESIVATINNKYREMIDSQSRILDAQAFEQWKNSMRTIQRELEGQFVTIEQLADKYKAFEVPCLIDLKPGNIAERGKGEEVLLEKIPELQQELAYSQEQLKSKLEEMVNSCEGIKSYKV